MKKEKPSFIERTKAVGLAGAGVFLIGISGPNVARAGDTDETLKIVREMGRMETQARDETARRIRQIPGNAGTLPVDRNGSYAPQTQQYMTVIPPRATTERASFDSRSRKKPN